MTMKNEVRNQEGDDTAELARRATRNVQELVRREAETFKDELADNLRNLKRPASELGVAAALGLTAFGSFLMSIGSRRRRGLLLLTSTAFGLFSYALAARAVRAAMESISFSRTAENVERAVDAVTNA